MKEDRIASKIGPSQHFRTVLEETLREGARQLLQQAIESVLLHFSPRFFWRKIYTKIRSCARGLIYGLMMIGHASSSSLVPSAMGTKS